MARVSNTGKTFGLYLDDEDVKLFKPEERFDLIYSRKKRAVIIRKSNDGSLKLSIANNGVHYATIAAERVAGSPPEFGRTPVEIRSLCLKNSKLGIQLPYQKDLPPPRPINRTSKKDRLEKLEKIEAFNPPIQTEFALEENLTTDQMVKAIYDWVVKQ